MKKVYLMIYDLGAGHRSTANALQKVIEKRQLPWEIHIVDAFKEIIGTTAPHYVYNQLILKKNWAKIINDPFLVPSFKLQIRLSRFAWLGRFKRYWQQHQPDMVVSLLPYINGLINQSLQVVSPNVPFTTVMTDHADCPPNFWIDPQGQFLICPTQRAVEQAKNLGYTQERIFSTSGVVIHPRFSEPVNSDRKIERKRLGLNPDLPTGLITFGSQGSKAMLEIADSLEKSSLNLQLIFICGRNEEIANTLRGQKSRLPRFIETFTSEIPYYMHLSDFFIGKSGSVGVSEAVAMSLPVITDCNALSMFQERPSAEWIAENEIGIVVPNFRDINQAVAKLIQPETLAQYRANAAAINNQGVFEVVDILEQILENSCSVAPSPTVETNKQLSSTV
ncbi:UDP-N-acetylglucosamine--LPS N-acetylglucosamine transferase [Nostoc flagelliforme FACHB-838]|uniref:UDP-N-acetylglucosamine--LPS N-acetylglucosamine transferase n=1 Tax=Nostoc flagelliforme FACHB-838 TaxID=2692904 RepID=A0ABR8DLZ3_9NOSO|nr:glycosyltransferase [Nostoc flagelliforme]MBD2529378.1 UDP-N-acetylglucosamine--LPS N-acetylglucosamine transferase [Nostoc flagelliforme FACHB-838]